MVRPEKHFYRDGRLDVKMAHWDQELSLQHKKWGDNLYAVDPDRLLTDEAFEEPDGLTFFESYRGKCHGIVEFKHINVEDIDYKSRKYSGHYDLATNRFKPIPFLIVVYNPEDWTFYVTPMNKPAKKYYGDVIERPTSERFLVRTLYEMRGLKPSVRLMRELSSKLPRKYCITR